MVVTGATTKECAEQMNKGLQGKDPDQLKKTTITWAQNLDYSESWAEVNQLNDALAGLAVIAFEIRPKVFNVVWMGPGQPEDFIHKATLEETRDTWFEATARLNKQWKHYGLTPIRWSSVT